MPFEPGKSGTLPGGLLALAIKPALLWTRDADPKAITDKCIELAKTGDSTALRLCMERLVPPRKEHVVCFEMPPLEKAADCIPVMAAIMRGVAEGDLTPGDAAALSKILDSYTRAVELTDLAERIAKLEQQGGERA